LLAGVRLQVFVVGVVIACAEGVPALRNTSSPSIPAFASSGRIED